MIILDSNHNYRFNCDCDHFCRKEVFRVRGVEYLARLRACRCYETSPVMVLTGMVSRATGLDIITEENARHLGRRFGLGWHSDSKVGLGAMIEPCHTSGAKSNARKYLKRDVRLAIGAYLREEGGWTRPRCFSCEAPLPRDSEIHRLATGLRGPLFDLRAVNEPIRICRSQKCYDKYIERHIELGEYFEDIREEYRCEQNQIERLRSVLLELKRSVQEPGDPTARSSLREELLRRISSSE